MGQGSSAWLAVAGKRRRLPVDFRRELRARVRLLVSGPRLCLWATNALILTSRVVHGMGLALSDGSPGLRAWAGGLAMPSAHYTEPVRKRVGACGARVLPAACGLGGGPAMGQCRWQSAINKLSCSLANYRYEIDWPYMVDNCRSVCSVLMLNCSALLLTTFIEWDHDPSDWALWK